MYPLKACRKAFIGILTCLFLSSTTRTAAFKYQHDADKSCSEHSVEECVTDEALWFKCPSTCSALLAKTGSMREVHGDPEAFYELQVTKENGNTLELEDFEGYITLYAVVPLLPGMAQFYYEMLEHVQSIFPYTVQIIMAPLQVTNPFQAEARTIKIKPHKKRKVIVLEEDSNPTSALEYLLKAQVVAGNDDADLPLDRVTIFMISLDGKFIEQLVSPTMTLLERRLSVFLKQLDFTTDL